MVEKRATEKDKRRLELKELRKQSKNRQLTQLRGQTLEVGGIQELRKQQEQAAHTAQGTDT